MESRHDLAEGTDETLDMDGGVRDFGGRPAGFLAGAIGAGATGQLAAPRNRGAAFG